MAASARLPTIFLGVLAVILVALAWKPWQRERVADLAAPDAPDAPVTSTTQPLPGDAATAPVMTTAMRARAVADEQRRSAAPQAQPPGSFTGPDGQQHEIVYNQGLILSPHAREQLKRELLTQMRQHPEAVSRVYQISPADIAAILAGTQAFPDKLLDQ